MGCPATWAADALPRRVEKLRAIAGDGRTSRNLVGAPGHAELRAALGAPRPERPRWAEDGKLVGVVDRYVAGSVRWLEANAEWELP